MLEANCWARGSGARFQAHSSPWSSFMHNHKQVELTNHSVIQFFCVNLIFTEHLHVLYLLLGTVFSLVILAFQQAGFRLPLRIITVTTSAILLLVSQASIPSAPPKKRPTWFYCTLQINCLFFFF